MTSSKCRTFRRLSIIVAIAAVVAMAATYFVGDYFLNYALKRGDNANTAPKASARISGKNFVGLPIPDFKHDEWEITSADGLKLRATALFPYEATHRWVILVHGYGRDRAYAYDYAVNYLNNGYNALAPDLRAAGKSEG